QIVLSEGAIRIQRVAPFALRWVTVERRSRGHRQLPGAMLWHRVPLGLFESRVLLPFRLGRLCSPQAVINARKPVMSGRIARRKLRGFLELTRSLRITPQPLQRVPQLEMRSGVTI